MRLRHFLKLINQSAGHSSFEYLYGSVSGELFAKCHSVSSYCQIVAVGMGTISRTIWPHCQDYLQGLTLKQRKLLSYFHDHHLMNVKVHKRFGDCIGFLLDAIFGPSCLKERYYLKCKRKLKVILSSFKYENLVWWYGAFSYRLHSIAIFMNQQ